MARHYVLSSRNFLNISPADIFADVSGSFSSLPRPAVGACCHPCFGGFPSPSFHPHFYPRCHLFHRPCWLQHHWRPLQGLSSLCLPPILPFGLHTKSITCTLWHRPSIAGAAPHAVPGCRVKRWKVKGGWGLRLRRFWRNIPTPLHDGGGQVFVEREGGDRDARCHSHFLSFFQIGFYGEQK